MKTAGGTRNKLTLNSCTKEERESKGSMPLKNPGFSLIPLSPTMSGDQQPLASQDKLGLTTPLKVTIMGQSVYNRRENEVKVSARQQKQ